MKKPDLSKPSLEGLSWLLRNEQEWKDKMKWDFGVTLRTNTCGTSGCAMGLASVVWPSYLLKNQEFVCAPDAFGITSGIVSELFDIEFLPAIYGVVHAHTEDVTPGMVADAIDYYLEHGELPDKSHE